MSLEQQLSDAIAAQNALTQAVAGKKAEIDAATAAQQAAFTAWMNSARSEYGRFNLLKNSLFGTDANADGIPDGFFSYTALPTGTTFSLVVPAFAADANPILGFPSDRSTWTDGQIAAGLLSEAWGQSVRGFMTKKPMAVMKVTCPSAINTTYGFALCQTAHHRNGKASRGLWIWSKTAGVSALNTDAPGPNSNPVNVPVAVPTKVWAFGDSSAEGYGFIASVFSSGAATFFVALPWVAEGYCDNWSAGSDCAA